MNKKLLSWIITFCAVGLGGTAAYYSIIGLSKLFAGVATAVIIMASFLELSKLTLATLLHSYWEKINILFKTYYIIALTILSLLTSIGIYGMLSSGYQETANKMNIINNQISLIETKRDNIKEQLIIYNEEKSSINTAITDLRNGLSNNVIQYKDADGNIISTTSSANRKSLEKQLEQAIERQSEINNKTDTLNKQLFDFENEIMEISINDNLSGELGPLKYLSGLTGVPMDRIINYLLLIIIFVFDPLAIALVIAANFSFEQVKKNYKENIYGEIILKQTPPPAPLPDTQSSTKKNYIDNIIPNKSIYDIEKEKIINTPGISAWKRNKMLKKLENKNNNDLTITY
jgi:chaperonin cofactor prefoldin